jgi:hypothetical protein
MRVGDGSIAGVARGNFETCVDTNGSFAILNNIATVDAVKVCSYVDETVVTLSGGEISEEVVVVMVVVVMVVGMVVVAVMVMVLLVLLLVLLLVVNVKINGKQRCR